MFRLPALFAALMVVCAAPRSFADDTVPPKLAPFLAAWVAAVDADDLKSAATFAADEKAADEQARLWDQIKAAHKKHDYRSWLTRKGGANDLPPGATTFKVGGHSYSHVHVDWKLTPAGWKIASVFLCR
jgi:hypothetical protein